MYSMLLALLALVCITARAVCTRALCSTQLYDCAARVLHARPGWAHVVSGPETQVTTDGLCTAVAGMLQARGNTANGTGRSVMLARCLQ